MLNMEDRKATTEPMLIYCNGSISNNYKDAPIQGVLSISISRFPILCYNLVFFIVQLQIKLVLDFVFQLEDIPDRCIGRLHCLRPSLDRILHRRGKGVEFLYCLSRFADLNNVTAMLPDAAGEIADERRQLIFLLIRVCRFQILLAIRICAAVVIRLAAEIISIDGAGANG